MNDQQDIYDLHMRRRSWIPGFTRHEEADVSRYVSANGERAFVMWHRFADGDSLQGRVARELMWFRDRGALTMYWKVYAHDQPSSLPKVLIDAGATRQDESLLHIVPVAQVLAHTRAFAGLAMHASSLSADLPRTLSVWDEVWPESAQEHVQWHAVYAQALDEAQSCGADPGVCFFTATDVAPMRPGTANGLGASYIIHPPGAPVALLCGGAVRASARGRGVYSALLHVRALWAQSRGVQSLAIEASPMSQPIVQKLGFTPLVSMAFYKFRF